MNNEPLCILRHIFLFLFIFLFYIKKCNANRIAFVKKCVFVLKCSYFALISSHKYIFTLGTKVVTLRTLRTTMSQYLIPVPLSIKHAFFAKVSKFYYFHYINVCTEKCVCLNGSFCFNLTLHKNNNASK